MGDLVTRMGKGQQQARLGALPARDGRQGPWTAEVQAEADLPEPLQDYESNQEYEQDLYDTTQKPNKTTFGDTADSIRQQIELIELGINFCHRIRTICTCRESVQVEDSIETFCRIGVAVDVHQHLIAGTEVCPYGQFAGASGNSDNALASASVIGDQAYLFLEIGLLAECVGNDVVIKEG